MEFNKNARFYVTDDGIPVSLGAPSQPRALPRCDDMKPAALRPSATPNPQPNIARQGVQG